MMLLLEKQSRIANDLPTMKQAALAIVVFCHDIVSYLSNSGAV
jgi:hypothetical protein